MPGKPNPEDGTAFVEKNRKKHIYWNFGIHSWKHLKASQIQKK
jgi:hypothetical protein